MKPNQPEDYKTNWYTLLRECFAQTGDDFSEMVCTLSQDGLHAMFDDDLGVIEGKPFTAWGERYVYFPVTSDGAEWVGYAPRNPCDIVTPHQGGGQG